MKKIIIYFLLFLLFTWLGLFISKDSGYILISYGNTTIETTLWAGIIVIFLAFLVFYFITRVDIGLQNLPDNIKKRLANRRAIKARSLLKKSIIATISGQWKKAEKALHRALKIKNNDMALINHITYAYLANQQGNHEKCDNYLSLANISDKKSALEIELLRAQFQVQNKQWQEAAVTLHQLQKIEPKHKMLLYLLQTTYLNLKEWHNLQLLFPLLRRYKILSPPELIQLEKIIYKELLFENIHHDQPDKVTKFWHKMPRSTHYDAEILTIYISFLREHSLHQKVEKLLFKFPDKIWDKRLIEQYSTFVSSKPLKQLKVAEKWLQQHPQDATLMLCLGRICKQQKLWGKARNYLEQSLKIYPTATIYYELGQIMEMQDDKAMALNYYRNGLRFTTNM